jgi:hypothetical protein
MSQPGGARAQSPDAFAELARTQTIRECAAHRDRGQTLRVDGHWLDARRALRGCAAEDCPIAIRSECQSWIDQLTTSIPSIVFVVEGDVQNALAAEIFVDGETDPERAYPSESPIELEPGEHRFRIEIPEHPPQTFTLAVSEGRRHRLVRVSFKRDTPSPPPPVADSPETAVDVTSTTKLDPVSSGADSPQKANEPGTPWLSYGLGLGAIVGIASATGIYVAARSDLDNARQTCSPLCSREKRESIERMFGLGDAVAVTSLVLAVAAVYFYESVPETKTGYQLPALELALGRQSAGLAFSHQF